MDMPGMDMTDTKASGNGATMDMGSMQGGQARRTRATRTIMPTATQLDAAGL
jgi:hypothetical protein